LGGPGSSDTPVAMSTSGTQIFVSNCYFPIQRSRVFLREVVELKYGTETILMSSTKKKKKDQRRVERTLMPT
jgi:hypothetical protein